MCIYTLVYILFALNSKWSAMLYEDVKSICKVMCSLVKQNVVC